ncbi:MAG: carboxypeptidase-like regulatory domain-containing protein, partial [Acidobacteria bacterium]|nr:carboxypeptidase-like regulatory domain-containing protein [Acidobacteriota bacterium]
MAYIVPGKTVDAESSKGITLDEGEARQNLDFSLVRGGVISGRVTDAEGKPMIARSVRVLRFYEVGRQYVDQWLQNGVMVETDDRGIYRIYGLFTGRYLISAGGFDEITRFGTPAIKYPRTYHPDATEEKLAKAIEIKEGDEVTDADIRLASPVKTYEASGRVIDAETGKPLQLASLQCNAISEDNNRPIMFSTSAQTDSLGNFRVVGLPSSRYVISLNISPLDNYSSEESYFEINDDNVSGLEVKAIRAASISGSVVLEGGSNLSDSIDPQRDALGASISPMEAGGNSNPARSSNIGLFAPIKNDGTFQLTGLPPGSVGFRFWGRGPNSPRIRRVERDGVEVKSRIEIRPGEKITNVRIVLVLANSTIVGQVKFIGGQFPSDYELWAIAERPG